MIYDFWVFWYGYLLAVFISLARCSDLYIFNDVVLNDFFSIIWDNFPLSALYFVNVSLCGLCSGFLNKVFFKSLNFLTF